MQTILWNAPFVVLPLLGFIALVPAPAGRRRLPAFGLVLLLVYGAGYLTTGLLTYSGAWTVPPLPVMLGQRVLDVALAAGFLLLLLGLTRRVRTTPAPLPDPAWSAPPPAAAGAAVPPGHGGPARPGSPGAYAPQPPGAQPLAAPPSRDAYPSGPHPGEGTPPAESGSAPQPPPPWQHGPSGGPQQPPDAGSRPNG